MSSSMRRIGLRLLQQVLIKTEGESDNAEVQSGGVEIGGVTSETLVRPSSRIVTPPGVARIHVQ
jgi:hypothetical protein